MSKPVSKDSRTESPSGRGESEGPPLQWMPSRGEIERQRQRAKAQNFGAPFLLGHDAFDYEMSAAMIEATARRAGVTDPEEILKRIRAYAARANRSHFFRKLRPLAHRLAHLLLLGRQMLEGGPFAEEALQRLCWLSTLPTDLGGEPRDTDSALCPDVDARDAWRPDEEFRRRVFLVVSEAIQAVDLDGSHDWRGPRATGLGKKAV